MELRRALCSIVLLLALATAALGAVVERPVTVSPGAPDRIETAPSRCPTFSWGSYERARRFELVVYEMPAGGAAATPPERPPELAVGVIGSALSWTPPADRCLEPATAYVWFVRGLAEDGSVGEWSKGGIFRTPRSAIWRQLESGRPEARQPLLAAAAAPPPAASPAGLGAPPAGSPPRWHGAPVTRAPDGSEQSALRSDAEVASAPSFGLYGWTGNNWDDSAGVVGYAAVTGRGYGVAGFTTSDEGAGVLGENEAATHGTGVLGENKATTHGVGVMGIDNASGGLSGGVVGITGNATGYGGLFWSYASPGSVLVVAQPTGDPPTSAVEKFRVETDGDVWADGSLGLEGGIDLGGDLRLLGAGVVVFTPTDTMPTCGGADEGVVYFDDSENWLCVCDGASFKRSDTGGPCS